MTQESSGSPDVDQIRDLEEDRLRRRLLAVERETERLRGRARIFGIGLLVSLVLAAVATLSPHLLALGGNSVDLDTVTARRMVLVDSEGVQRGEWRVDEEGNSRLRVLDRRSRTRLSFSVLSDGSPGLSLTNANGKRRAGLALLSDESTSLVFADATGVPRTILGISPSDASSILFIDADGATRMAIGLEGSGEPNVLLPGNAETELSGGGGS